MKSKDVIACLCVLTTLAACSSSSETTDSDNNTHGETPTSIVDIVGSLDDVQRIGWTFMSDDSTFQQVSLFGTFFENSGNGAVNELVSTMVDTCSVELLDASAPLLEDRLLNEYTSISAGETITLTSPAGNYTDISRMELQSGIGYIALNNAPYPSPQQLTITVPGDVFSATSISVEKPVALEGVSLTLREEVAAEKSVSWNPAADDNTLVYLYFTDSNNIDLYVECAVNDDGVFDLPASIHTQADTLLGGSATILFDGSSRVRFGSKRTNGELFVLSRSSS